MRILFDARGVQDRSDGMSNYVRHILTGLIRMDTTNEYVVLLTTAFRNELEQIGLLERPNVHPLVTSIPFMGLSQQVRLPAVVRRLPGVSLYHYPHFDMPILVHPRGIVTIYDLNHINFAAYFDSLRPLKRGYSLGTTWLSLRRAAHIITISHATKRQLLNRFPWLDPCKVTVTYFGVSETFRATPSPEKLAAFRRKYHLADDRCILYVGTDRPHKNLDRLLAAYARLRRDRRIAHKLLLVGASQQDSLGQDHGAAREANDGVVRLGYVPEDELPLAYRIAEVFVFCSLSEGFGMPLLEAIASGVPVVTSNVGAMAEIVGDSAQLVDPFSVESITEGLAGVLSSEALRRALTAKGVERVQRFRWEEAARKTLEVYNAVGKRPWSSASTEPVLRTCSSWEMNT